MNISIRRLLLFAIIFLLGVFVFWGCPKKSEVATTPEQKEETPEGKEVKKAPMPTEEAKPEEKEETKEAAAAAQAGLKTIYFDFDQFFIRADQRSILKANAEWMKAHPKTHVRIEGSSDERGTREYNQALGQRRAASAKKYLTDLGISGSRISLVSYGKEKPVCTESTEQCWQKNRRDDFAAE